MNSTSATLLSSVLLLLPLCLASGAPVQDARPNAGFRHYVVGNPADVVQADPRSAGAQGGGDDVDANYVRMGEFGGGGDFVVLRASGEDEYNDYIFGLCHCDSVETIVFDEARGDLGPVRDRDDPQRRGDLHRRRRPVELHPVLEGHAGRGRDQLRRGQARARSAAPAPAWRSSASTSIRRGQGEPDQRGRARRSLRAGPHARARIPGRCLDSRACSPTSICWERDRIGRTVALLARLRAGRLGAQAARDRGRPRDGAAHRPSRREWREVFATADHPTPYVYFMRSRARSRALRAWSAAHHPRFAVYRLAPGGRFDLAAWQGHGGIAYELSVDDGRPAFVARRQLLSAARAQQSASRRRRCWQNHFHALVSRPTTLVDS